MTEETLDIEIDQIDTPALIIDLELMENNIASMAKFFEGADADLRPHSKTHKIPVIAHKQIAAGAKGICCQKLGEAEVMAAAGIEDILITNQIVGPRKLWRLANLSRNSGVTVAVDSLENAEMISKAAVKKETKVNVIVEINVGIDRCGVEPGEPTLKFTRQIIRLPGLNFKGIMGYEGPFMSLPNWEERKKAAIKRLRLLVETSELLKGSGIDLDIVSAGATGTYNITGAYPGVTEVEAGSYVFMDTTYRKLEGVNFNLALSLLTTVTSRPTEERVVVDAGMKAITREFGMPEVKGIDGLELQKLSEEHGTLRSTTLEQRPKIGDKIELYPSHCCTTVNLHDVAYGVRDGKVESTWRIEGRGRFT
ncbi:MAG: DSD1 family PLP-dependent enzyme [Candidatus Bathyarchaeota archaeon]|nr:MAG: DSD1 family PLP-dependent enzyme [Candidatus Bathyarchaeota archaeon]